MLWALEAIYVYTFPRILVVTRQTRFSHCNGCSLYFCFVKFIILFYVELVNSEIQSCHRIENCFYVNMDYWFLFRHSSSNKNKLMISSWSFIIMSILLFNIIGFAVSQEHQQKPKSSKIRFPGPSGYSGKHQHLEQLGENQLQPPNQLHLIGFQPVNIQSNYQQQPSALLLGVPAPQQQLYSQFNVNQHNNPVVVQSAKPQSLPGPIIPAIIPSHYLLSNIQQQVVVNPMHLVLLTPKPHPPPSGYQQQQIVSVPMKQEEYEVSPNTTPKQEEIAIYNQPSIDVDEILFYPDKVLASFVPSGSESFKPLPAAY